MEITRFEEAQRYDAPKHFDMRGLAPAGIRGLRLRPSPGPGSPISCPAVAPKWIAVLWKKSTSCWKGR